MSILSPIMDLFSSHFNYFLIIIHFLYAFVFMGLIYLNESYLTTLNILIQFAICLFLLIRFHPFQRHELRQYDANIIFSCAAFLMVNLGAIELTKKYAMKIEKYIE
uniref:Uncharacterized protein n=1 Tax=viral metagenome TaxID=1070528 RepID=A0A6C0H1H4_9ZZZZ